MNKQTQNLIGTALTPDLEKFHAKVDQIHDAISSKINNKTEKDFVEAHNLYTAYTVMLLLHGSGHRPVADPFCDISQTGPGFGLVEDKAATERHRNRLVALPPTVLHQLTLYRSHLHGLLAYLPPASTPVTDLILSQGPGCEGLPRFFFLEASGTRTIGVRVRTILQWLRDWPWPLNAGRHLLAQGLHRRGVPTRIVRLQLGQLGWGDAFFGSDESLTPEAFVHYLQNPLEQVLVSDQGWRPLAGYAQQTDLEPGPALTRPSPSQFHHPWPPGPRFRAQQRREKERKTKEAVGPWKQRIQEAEGAHSVLQAALEDIQSHLEDAPDLANRARNNLLTWMWRNYPWQAKASGLPRQVSVPSPSSPFSSSWPRQLQKAFAYQQAFLRYLQQKGDKGHRPSSGDRLAEIIVSAALWGGVGARGRLEQLPRAVTDSAWTIKNARSRVLFQEIWVGEANGGVNLSNPEWRWLPDSLSATLIDHYFEGFSDSKRKSALGAIKEKLIGLIQDLENSLSKSFSTEKPENPYTLLANLANSLALFQQEPFIRPFVVGEHHPTPLPRTSWFRLVRGKAPKDLEASQTEPYASTETAIAPRPKAAYVPDADAALQFHTSLTEIFQNLRKKRDQVFLTRDEKLKQELRETLDDLLAPGHSFPYSAVTLSDWTIKLIAEGTRFRRKLKFNTIQRYVLRLAYPLLHLAQDLDIGKLNPEEMEELYQEMLTYPRTPKEQNFLAGRIQEFHAFLEHFHGFDPLDWSFLPDGEGPQYADAQIITLAEYQRALKDLLADPQVDESGHLLQAGALVLGFRFGLRSGEVARCRAPDLVLDPARQLAQVTVQPNRYGGTKSRAATRLVPSTEILPDEEIRILQDLRHRAINRAPGDPQAQALMGQADSPHAIWGRDQWAPKVQKALRMASGDPRLRFHHLRHSFACRLLLRLRADHWHSALLAQIHQSLAGPREDAEGLRQWIAGQSHWDRRLLDAWAEILGHKNPATSIAYYFHFPEILTKQVAEAHLPAPIPKAVWAYCRGIQKNTLNSWLTRQKQARLPIPPVSGDWPKAVPELPLSPRKGPYPSAFPNNRPNNPN